MIYTLKIKQGIPRKVKNLTKNRRFHNYLKQVSFLKADFTAKNSTLRSR